MDNFIPFGSQYYRAPTPTPDKWDRDLKQFSDSGFNTIKIWAVWRWNNPAENIYDFSDLDVLMDIAGKYHLKVIINTIFDSAPAWFYMKYENSLMIYSDGRKLYPRAISCRQSGGAPGPCYNHKKGIEVRLDFLSEIIRRYRNHPALYLWDLWNEPEMTTSISREPSIRDMVCYCDNCREKFILWLNEKYNNIGGLNRAWNRNYNDFREIELPRCGDTFNDMIDWRMFFADVLTGELKLRLDTAKSIDSEHPMMVHIVPMPYFNIVNACCDDYAMAMLCDLFGNSVGSSPLAASATTTAANGKKVINAEIHALGGSTLYRPLIPSFEDFKKHIFLPLSRGVKGFIFWQYRPETLGVESPAWGLTNPDGSKTEWHIYSEKINNAIQKYRDVISNAGLPESTAAVVNSYKNQIFDFCACGNIHRSNASLMGAYMMLYNANITTDIICAEHMTLEELRKYKIIYYPFPYYMDKKTADMLRQYVYEGGSLISEAFFAACRADDGYHSEITPGFDMNEVFGVKEKRVIMAGDARVFNAYNNDGEASVNGNIFDIYTINNSKNIKGYIYREELEPSGAEVLACFSGNIPAVTINRYGRGKAVYIGSIISAAYNECGDINSVRFVSELSEILGGDEKADSDMETVRVDILLSGSSYIVFVNNLSDNDVWCNIILKIRADRDYMTDIMSGEQIPLNKEFDTLTADIRIKGGSCEVYVI